MRSARTIAGNRKLDPTARGQFDVSADFVNGTIYRGCIEGETVLLAPAPATHGAADYAPYDTIGVNVLQPEPAGTARTDAASCVSITRSTRSRTISLPLHIHPFIIAHSVRRWWHSRLRQGDAHVRRGTLSADPRRSAGHLPGPRASVAERGMEQGEQSPANAISQVPSVSYLVFASEALEAISRSTSISSVRSSR